METVSSFNIGWVNTETLLGALRQAVRKEVQDDACSLVPHLFSEDVAAEALASVEKLIGFSQRGLSRTDQNYRRQVIEVAFKGELFDTLNKVYPKDSWYPDGRYTFKESKNNTSEKRLRAICEGVAVLSDELFAPFQKAIAGTPFAKLPVHTFVAVVQCLVEHRQAMEISSWRLTEKEIQRNPNYTPWCKNNVQSYIQSHYTEETSEAEARAIMNGFYFLYEGTRALLLFCDDGDLTPQLFEKQERTLLDQLLDGDCLDGECILEYNKLATIDVKINRTLSWNPDLRARLYRHHRMRKNIAGRPCNPAAKKRKKSDVQAEEQALRCSQMSIYKDKIGTLRSSFYFEEAAFEAASFWKVLLPILEKLNNSTRLREVVNELRKHDNIGEAPVARHLFQPSHRQIKEVLEFSLLMHERAAPIKMAMNVRNLSRAILQRIGLDGKIGVRRALDVPVLEEGEYSRAPLPDVTSLLEDSDSTES